MIHKLIIIGWNDFKQQEDALRILKKSYARYRKHGFNGMRQRLNKEYIKITQNFSYSIKPSAYHAWIIENESNAMFTPAALTSKPLISIVMPVYNANTRYLRKALDSVLSQSYQNWELCIADDASTQKACIATLKAYEKKDPRIKVVYRQENGHISLASNSALEAARGEWVTFIDHDDMLSPHALYELAKCINANTAAKIIYSDEDKIDVNDVRFDPHLKPDWNPDMFFSHNYLAHLCAVKQELITAIGGFRADVAGSQDYDLILRCLPRIQASEIVHIPKILYHWRATENSTASNAAVKPYTQKAGIKALQDYFTEHYPGVLVQPGLLPNTYKPVYPIPGMTCPTLHACPSASGTASASPLVTLLIPTRDRYDLLHKCIDGIRTKTNYTNYEIIILDNESSDPQTLEYFKELNAYPNISVMEYHYPFNYSAINNFGVRHAKGEIIGLINNDIEIISEGWLTEMVQHAIRPEIGAVGAKLYFDNDTIQHAGIILGIGGVAGHSHKYYPKNHAGYFSRLKIIQNYAAVTAACLLVRKALYEEVGGLNEENLKVAFNDVDFCLKIEEKGYRNLWTPYAEAYHHESLSRGADDTHEKMKRFQKEIAIMQHLWPHKLHNDPHYNPNLTLEHENFSLQGQV